LAQRQKCAAAAAFGKQSDVGSRKILLTLIFDGIFCLEDGFIIYNVYVYIYMHENPKADDLGIFAVRGMPNLRSQIGLSSALHTQQTSG
jgi:hypothetical protein